MLLVGVHRLLRSDVCFSMLFIVFCCSGVCILLVLLYCVLFDVDFHVLCVLCPWMFDYVVVCHWCLVVTCCGLMHVVV